MEKKNMVLLTVIAVATLLVAVVGATFAYFTATANPSGSAEATVTTNKLDGANVTFASEGKLQMLDYPGGLAVYGAKATIEKQQAEDQNHYQATFNLKITYTNPTGTDLDWTLYMVESKYDNLDASEITTCKLRNKINENELQLWYSDSDSGDPTEDAGCKGEVITTKLTQELNAKTIASGKLLKNQLVDKEITKDTSTDDSGEYQKGEGADLEGRAINTSDKTDKYYYLVVKYPNKNENQSPTDEKKEIKVSLSIDGTVNLSLYPTPGIGG